MTTAVTQAVGKVGGQYDHQGTSGLQEPGVGRQPSKGVAPQRRAWTAATTAGVIGDLSQRCDTWRPGGR